MQQKVSSLELENKLLKREVSSLNDELNTLLERVREAEEREAAHRGESEGLREQTSRSAGVMWQLQSHHEDLQAAMEARDSQIQVRKEDRGREKEGGGCEGGGCEGGRERGVREGGREGEAREGRREGEVRQRVRDEGGGGEGGRTG